MKKQLYRVKQLADQRVGRAEKTDLLTEDLQHVEKTVDRIKVACSTTGKKLTSCMLSSGPDVERRKKKLNQLALGQSMLECANILGDTSLLGNVLLCTGEAQSGIAGELATYETEVDEQIMAPLQNLVDNSIPNIALTKKKLSKARLDMDAVKNRWLNAVKVSQSSNSNKLDNAAKADLLKSEMEDQTALFHQLQDQLATEMFTFVAGERSYAQWFSQMLDAQIRYHQASLEVLQKHLPVVHELINLEHAFGGWERLPQDILRTAFAHWGTGDSMFRPVFSCPLDDHLRITDREIAFVIEECILYLLENAMDIEGLFRLAGSSTKIKKLKAAFDAGVVDMEDFENEIHTVTGVLKLYLRELPEPLLKFELHDEWINASRIKDRDQKLQAYWSLVEKLPASSKTNLRYLICFLSKLAENSDENKMSASNIAIVIGPNLLWSNKDDAGVSIANTGNISNIVESLIEHCDWFFPDGCDFTRHQISEEKLETMSMRFSAKDGSAETPGSPEMPANIMGGGLFSEVSKKLGWKEGAASSEVSVNSASIQGYYNPLAAQYDPDLDNAHEEVTIKSPTTNPSAPPNYPAPAAPPRPTPSSPVPGVNDQAPPYSAHRSNSTGDEAAKPTHKRQNSSGAPRRPAPPIPKHHPKPKLPDKVPQSPKSRAPRPPDKPSTLKEQAAAAPPTAKEQESLNDLLSDLTEHGGT